MGFGIKTVIKLFCIKQRWEETNLKIDISYGSGGKSTSELISKVFAKHFDNDILNKMEDSAVIELNGKIAYTTDSYVVTPLFFKGGDIGKLSVCGTVNDLLMLGAKPLYLTAGFIIETGIEIEVLEKIAISMKNACLKANVKIVAGDTKVIEGNGGIYINTSGIGVIPNSINVSSYNCSNEDVIIVSGNLGDHHSCILSKRMDIENDICSDCANLNNEVNVLFENNIKVKALRDITRGGLATILNEICVNSKCQAIIEESKLPIDKSVLGFCQVLGLDPLYMGNEGKFLAVIEKNSANKAIELLRKTENGKNSAIIGYMQEGNGVIMKTRLGGERMVDVLYGEGLPRIC